MYSKALELTGMALLAVGVAMLLGPASGIITGGVELVFVGSVTDDRAVTAAVRRAGAHATFLFHRQRLREQLAAEQAASPHPPIYVDPEAQALADRLVKQRLKRGDGRMTEALP